MFALSGLYVGLLSRVMIVLVSGIYIYMYKYISKCEFGHQINAYLISFTHLIMNSYSFPSFAQLFWNSKQASKQ